MHERLGPIALRRAPTSSSIGTISGGSLAIRGSPSTRCVSLPSARRLSFARAFATLLLEALALLARVASRRPARGDVLDVEARVPEVHRAHRGEARASPRGTRAPTARLIARRCLASKPRSRPGDREARDEPLDVPLERPGKRLVEVVDAEDQPPVGRGVDAEVRQVRVAAQLRVSPVRGVPARSAAIRAAAPR